VPWLFLMKTRRGWTERRPARPSDTVQLSMLPFIRIKQEESEVLKERIKCYISHMFSLTGQIGRRYNWHFPAAAFSVVHHDGFIFIMSLAGRPPASFADDSTSKNYGGCTAGRPGPEQRGTVPRRNAPMTSRLTTPTQRGEGQCD
jgi:hypothetical protein